MKNIYKGILLLGGGYLLYRLLHKNPQGVITLTAEQEELVKKSRKAKTIVFDNIQENKPEVADVTMKFAGGTEEYYPNQSEGNIILILQGRGQGTEIVFNGSDLTYLEHMDF